MRRTVLPAVLLTASLAVAGTAAPATPTPDDRAALATALAAAEASLRQGEAQVAESRYREVLGAGWRLLGGLAAARGDDSAARQAFERAVGATVEHRRASTALALVEMGMGETATAARRLQALLLDDPGDLRVRRLLAAALAADGRPQEAIQELEEARARTPDDPELAYTLATAHLRAGQAEEAAAIFAEVVRQRPIPATHVLLGRTYRDAGDYARAEAELRRALELDAATPRAHFYLATLHLLDGRRAELDAAIGELRRELEVSPDDPSTHLYLGMALVEARRPQEAVAPLRVAARTPGTAADADLFLGRALVAVDRSAEAVEAFRRALERAEAGQGTDGERLRSIHYQLGLALRRTGDQDAARRHLEAAEAITDTLTAESRGTLQRYIESDPDEAYGGPSVPRLDTSAYDALTAAERAELKGVVTEALTRAYLNLGILRARSGEPGRAAGLVAEAAALAPDFPGVQRSLGVLLFEAGRHAEAVAPLSRARAAAPGDGDLGRMLGMARLESGDYAGAAEVLGEEVRRATRAGGGDADPALLYAYGLALVRGGRGDEAEAVFADLLTGHAGSARVHALLGEAQADQGDFAAAVEHFRRAVELDPAVAEARTSLGVLHLRRGELPEAEAALRGELEHHPGALRPRYLLATVLELSDRPAEAEAELRRVLAAEPAHARARYLLGKVLLDQERPADAAAELETAAALAPGDPGTAYQLGRAYQALERRDEAAEWFARYRELKAAERGAGGDGGDEDGQKDGTDTGDDDGTDGGSDGGRDGEENDGAEGGRDGGPGGGEGSAP